jgi:hypothetical protein
MKLTSDSKACHGLNPFSSNPLLFSSNTVRMSSMLSVVKEYSRSSFLFLERVQLFPGRPARRVGAIRA